MINYTKQYNPFLELGSRVSKGSIKPHGLYKISSYDYVDEGIKRLSGDDATLIFVTGIFERKVSSLKLSNIPPTKFLNWFKTVHTGKYTETDTNKIGLYEVQKPFDKGGNIIYDNYIKNKEQFVAKGAAYRTYKLDGIKYATEVFLTNDTIRRYYG